MSQATTTRLRDALGRVGQVWAELDYAQRRLLEIRTGIPMSTPGTQAGHQARRIPASVDELEDLYTLEYPLEE